MAHHNMKANTYGGVAQLVERLPCTQKVAGSIPVTSTIVIFYFGFKMLSLENALLWRYATKKFDTTKKISKEDFQTILKTLHYSPSSFGLQPWKFVVIESISLREQLLPIAFNQRQVVEASHLLVLARPTELTELDIEKYLNTIAETREVTLESLDQYRQVMGSFIQKFDVVSKASWMEKQVYIASGFLMLGCAMLQIDTCPMEGFNRKACDEILGFEKLGLKSVMLCPIGYRSPDDKYADQTKVRYAFEEMIITL